MYPIVHTYTLFDINKLLLVLLKTNDKSDDLSGCGKRKRRIKIKITYNYRDYL